MLEAPQDRIAQKCNHIRLYRISGVLFFRAFVFLSSSYNYMYDNNAVCRQCPPTSCSLPSHCSKFSFLIGCTKRDEKQRWVCSTSSRSWDALDRFQKSAYPKQWHDTFCKFPFLLSHQKESISENCQPLGQGYISSKVP